MTQAEKLKKTMIAKYGSEKAWREAQASFGRKGGKISRGGGFSSMSKQKRQEAGRKGGLARHGKV